MKIVNIRNHLFYLLVLYLYYLIPYFFTGSLFIRVGDFLDSSIVYNSVAAKIALGDLDAIKVFLGGELPWQFLKGILYPITAIYGLLDVEKAFWLTDIILRTIAYFSFYYLSKKTNNNSGYSLILSLLYATSIPNSLNGLAIVTLPYLAALLTKKNLNFKNYFSVFFIGLNSDLYLHVVYLIPSLIIFYLALNYENKDKFSNYRCIIKMLGIYLISTLLVNSPLIYSILYLRPFHSEDVIRSYYSFTNDFNIFFKNFYPNPNPDIFENYLFYIFIFLIFFFSFYNKEKKNIIILVFIILTSLFKFIYNLETINNLKLNHSLLNATNFDRFYQVYYFFYLYCFFSCQKLIKKKYKLFILFLVISSIIYNLLYTNIKTITAFKSGYYNLTYKERKVIIDNYQNLNFLRLFKNLKEIKNSKVNKNNNSIDSSTVSSIKSYYQFDDYKIIKNFVKNDKIISVGIDPMKAAINGINIIDGYYYLYPLSYKYKFLNLFLDKDSNNNFKYIKKWGHKLLITNYNMNLININHLKEMGASYILSNKALDFIFLDTICSNCNNNINFYLYRIK